MSRTQEAFDRFREQVGTPRLPPPHLIANADQTRQMTATDGLREWEDGADSAKASPPTEAPLLTTDQLDSINLWVVRSTDVVHALEKCSFGSNLETGVIKHTNLTGGEAAYSGGELLFLEDGTIVVNGCSGRYGPRSPKELESVVAAFAQSGYQVWYMGFDEEANRPLPFLGVRPQWFQ